MSKKTISITREELELIMRVLSSQLLSGFAARSRNQFIKLTDKDYSSQFDSRKQILESFADKDEAGVAKNDDNKMYVIPQEKQADAKEALVKFYKEVLEYSDLKVFRGVMDILNKTGFNFTVEDGKVYDEVLTKIENQLK